MGTENTGGCWGKGLVWPEGVKEHAEVGRGRQDRQDRKCRGGSIAWNSSLPCSSLNHCLCIQRLVAEVRFLLVQPQVAESTAETTLFYPRGDVLAVRRGTENKQKPTPK